LEQCKEYAQLGVVIAREFWADFEKMSRNCYTRSIIGRVINSRRAPVFPEILLKFIALLSLLGGISSRNILP
jgi:hypothetical protein